MPLLYQFLHCGDNPNESVFNVRLTAPLPASGERPSVAKININSKPSTLEELAA